MSPAATTVEARDAIDAWHGALSDSVAADAAGWLSARLERRGLLFGNRPLCNVLRPRFLTPAQYDLMRRRIAVLLSAFARALPLRKSGALMGGVTWSMS